MESELFKERHNRKTMQRNVMQIVGKLGNNFIFILILENVFWMKEIINQRRKTVWPP